MKDCKIWSKIAPNTVFSDRQKTVIWAGRAEMLPTNRKKEGVYSAFVKGGA